MTIRFETARLYFASHSRIFLICTFAFYAKNEQAKLTQSIVADRVIPMEQLKVIADAYAVDIVDAVHKVRSGAFSFAQGQKSVDAAMGKIDRKWSDYMATYLTPEKRALPTSF